LTQFSVVGVQLPAGGSSTQADEQCQQSETGIQDVAKRPSCQVNTNQDAFHSISTSELVLGRVYRGHGVLTFGFLPATSGGAACGGVVGRWFEVWLVAHGSAHAHNGAGSCEHALHPAVSTCERNAVQVPSDTQQSLRPKNLDMPGRR
jgi:hypothetical protein